MKKIQMLRLIADEGKILTNGKTTAEAVDCFVDKENEWKEIDAQTAETTE